MDSTSKKANRSTSSGSSRKSCIFCSLSSAFFCLGVIILVVGIVFYILTGTSAASTDYLNNLLHNPESKFQASIIIAIVLGSIGGLFILLAIIFAIAACVSNDDCCSSSNSNSSEDYETTVKFTNGLKQHHVEEEKLLSPMIDSKESRAVSVNVNTSRFAQDTASPTYPSSYGHSEGDLNTVGLPSTNPGRHRVPPNGFSYLAHPSEIQSYHESRHTPLRHQQPDRINSTNGFNARPIQKKESAI